MSTSSKACFCVDTFFGPGKGEKRLFARLLQKTCPRTTHLFSAPIAPKGCEKQAVWSTVRDIFRHEGENTLDVDVVLAEQHNHVAGKVRRHDLPHLQSLGEKVFILQTFSEQTSSYSPHSKCVNTRHSLAEQCDNAYLDSLQEGVWQGGPVFSHERKCNVYYRHGRELSCFVHKRERALRSKGYNGRRMILS